MQDKVLHDLVEVLLDNKAIDVVYVNITNVNPLCEYYVIATVNSNRQALALAKHCEDKLYENNERVSHIEGNSTSEWVLLDGGNYVVHLFVNEARNKYSLEKMWSNLDIIKVG